MSRLFLPAEVAVVYERLRDLPDGRVIGVKRLMFHWTLHVGIDHDGYEENYCFATKEGALAALDAWDGTGDPEGWHRHPKSGRRRDPATGREWVAH